MNYKANFQFISFKKLKDVVSLYYGFQLFFSLLIWLPIFYEYQKHFGLSDQEIFLIQSYYYIAFCLLEIPTGLIADLWSYRRCMKAGSVVLAITHLFPIFWPSFTGFLLHFMGIALSRSLISGASSAYLYEYLKSKDSISEFRNIEGKSRAYSLVAKVVAWSCVGFLMQAHITLPYWLTLASALLSIFFASRLPQLEIIQNKKNSLIENSILIAHRLTKSMQLIYKNTYLSFLILQGIAIFVLGRIIQVNLFQPILSAKDIQIPYHGAIMALMTVFEALGSGYPNVIRNRFSSKNSVFLLTLLLGVALIAIPLANNIASILILCFFSYAIGLAYPIQRQLFNDSITDSSYRATLMSIESIVDRAVCAWVAGGLGLILTTPTGLNEFLFISGAITCFSVFVLIVSMKKLRKLKP